MLTTEEIRNRATSPLAALEVSIEEWIRKAQLPADKLGEYGLLGPGRCGLCQYFGLGAWGRNCDKNGKGECVLSIAHKDRGGCCTEYQEVQRVCDDYRIDRATEAEVRGAFWLMVVRLQKEKVKLLENEKAEASKTKKPARQIRHGDFVQWRKGGPIYVATEQEPLSGTWDIWAKGGYVNGRVPKRSDWYKSTGINVFDLAEAMRAGGTELQVNSTHAQSDYLWARLASNGKYINLNINGGYWPGFEFADVEKIAHGLLAIVAEGRAQCKS